jgi:hypothetical protein
MFSLNAACYLLVTPEKAPCSAQNSKTGNMRRNTLLSFNFLRRFFPLLLAETREIPFFAYYQGAQHAQGGGCGSPGHA